MAFPATSETFACLEVRTLREAGLSVSVYALRPAGIRGEDEPFGFFTSRARGREAAQLLADRGLGDLPVNHTTSLALLRGSWVAVTHPSTLLDLLAWLWRRNWQSPRHLIKSLVLVPRCLDIFSSIRRARPDVVHLFWGHYPTIVGYLVHRHLPDVVLSMFLGAYDLNRCYPGSAAVARAADVVWTHCRHNVRGIAALAVPSSRLRVAYRGVDVEAFFHRGSRKVPRRVVTAGRLLPQKGMDDVLMAFAKVHGRWPEASLVVLGDGPERSRLVSRARALGIGSAVTFRGHVGHDQVRQEMASAEVFVLLSKSASERLPNAVKEAMASRCACVVTNTPGIEELVEDGLSGLLVPYGDVEGAARQIAHLLHDPERAAAVASVAQERVCAQFDVRRSIRAYQECWTELLQRRPHESPELPQLPPRSPPVGAGGAIGDGGVVAACPTEPLAARNDEC